MSPEDKEKMNFENRQCFYHAAQERWKNRVGIDGLIQSRCISCYTRVSVEA